MEADLSTRHFFYQALKGNYGFLQPGGAQKALNRQRWAITYNGMDQGASDSHVIVATPKESSCIDRWVHPYPSQLTPPPKEDPSAAGRQRRDVV
jgi:hypothetical protein